MLDCSHFPNMASQNQERKEKAIVHLLPVVYLHLAYSEMGGVVPPPQASGGTLTVKKYLF